MKLDISGSNDVFCYGFEALRSTSKNLKNILQVLAPSVMEDPPHQAARSAEVIVHVFAVLAVSCRLIAIVLRAKGPVGVAK